MNNKKNTKDAYNAIANRYYEEYKNDTKDFKYIDRFLNKCHFKILDLGCGMGHYSKYIKSKGFQVCGVDFSDQLLNIAREHNPEIQFIEADICDLPENLGQNFDGILLAYVIQHLSKEETKKVLLDCHNYITDLCQVLIFFRAGNQLKKEKEPFDESFEYTIKEYNEKEITALLNECGYDVIEIEEQPFVDDEYSLCPTTLVLYAQKAKTLKKVN